MHQIQNWVGSVLFILVVIVLRWYRIRQRQAYLEGLQRSQQRLQQKSQQSLQAQEPLPPLRLSSSYKPRMNLLPEAPDVDAIDWNVASRKN